MDWALALFALLTIVAAWWGGKQRRQIHQNRHIATRYPDSLYRLASHGKGLWKVFPKGKKEAFYLATGKAQGYAGGLKVAVELAPEGRIQKIQVLSASETPSYLSKIYQSDYLEAFRGKACERNISRLAQTDGVTGATQTSRAIARAGEQAARRITSEFFPDKTAPSPTSRVKFGIQESILLLLFALTLLSWLPRLAHKKKLHRICLYGGLIFLGFVYNRPLTLTQINGMLAGHWPQWQHELFTYILIFATLIILLITGRNPYCSSICPFKGFQDALGNLGRAKTAPLYNRRLWTWIQRSLAWGAVLIALWTRNPGISDYEVFGAAFHLTGSRIMFLLLGIITIVSLFIRKPWCNFLCPIKPVASFIKLFRYKMIRTWKNTKPVKCSENAFCSSSCSQR